MTAFRGPSSYPNNGAGMSTGGSVVVNNNTGTVPGSVGSWHPTVLYLFALLVVEWVVLVWISKYI